MTNPFVGEIKMTKVIKDGKEVIEWEPVDMSKHAEGNLGIGSGEMELGGVKWDASAFQRPEPRITFHPGDPMKEVMRIDRHGVKVNPEYTVDEATQHVLNALSAHIQHTVNHAVAQEREAIMDEWWMCVQSDLENGVKSVNERAAERWHKEYPAISGFDAAIRARSNT